MEMTGIQNIFTNRAFTLEELIQFMRQNWDTEQYNDFIIDRPHAAVRREGHPAAGDAALLGVRVSSRGRRAVQ